MNDDTDGNISENDFQLLKNVSNEYQVAIETKDAFIEESSRILFSVDVHPNQRHRYLTDRFNTEDGSHKNGDIAYLQGLKTEKQVGASASIWPCLRIPRELLLSKELTLLLYAVYEEKENQMRIWYKNHRKGFLSPEQLAPNAKLFNPFKLVLNGAQCTKNGDYILKILLLTDLDKTRLNKEEIYRLDEQKTLAIHQAENIQVSRTIRVKSTRIICVQEVNNKPFWPSFTISNYIQPPQRNNRPISSNNTSSVLNGFLTPLNAMNVPVLSISQHNLPTIQPNNITIIQHISPPTKKQKYDKN